MDRLAELLLEWEDRRARGEPAGPEVLCPDDAVLRADLAKRIRSLEKFEAFTNPAAAPKLPDRVGKYEVRRLLGAGGMGVVYEARDPDLDRAVAVKVVRPDYAALVGPRAIARFAREMRVLGQLRGRASVVPVYHAETAPVPYLVMDYLPGGSLAAHRERLTTEGAKVVLPLMEAVARAVHAAHRKGVLHRDLKPGNVLLDEDGNPFVADFGLAALLAADDTDPGEPAAGSDDTRPELTALTTTDPGRGRPGTPEYMAPEQHDPRFGRVGPAADVWALGVILYELLAGRRPFAATSRPDLAEAITSGPAPPLPGAGKRLTAVVARCLEKDPARRFRSAGELADALERLRRPSRRAAMRFGAGGLLAAVAGVPAWRRWVGDPDGSTGVPLAGETHATPPDPELEGYTDPAAVREALAKLERGETVTLVNGGPPAAYRLNLGPASGRVLDRPDGWAVRAIGEYCVVELLPRLPPGEWVIEADVRHESAHPNGHVGIFAAGTRGRTPDGAEVLVFAVTVTFAGDVNQAIPRLVWLRDTKPATHLVAERWYHQRFSIPPPADGLGRLSLVVGPGAVRAGLGDEPFPACTVDKLWADRQAILTKQGPRPVPPEVVIRPHGGVGVYVRFATAWVGKFRVRPGPARE